MTKSKKAQQLGMNESTARGRLLKDILWSLVVKTGQSVCCKCGNEMSRETFSIEHVVPWLDSQDPIGMFFSLDNISYSHISCNVSDARKPGKYSDPETKRLAKNERIRQRWSGMTKEEQQASRRDKYLRHGK